MAGVDADAAGREFLQNQRTTALRLFGGAGLLCSHAGCKAISNGGSMSLAFPPGKLSDVTARTFADAALAKLSPGIAFAAREPVVVAAVPNEYVSAVEKALEAIGRVVTFREPCRLVIAMQPSPAATPALKAGYTWCTTDGTVYEMGRCKPYDVPRMLSQWKYASPAAGAKLRQEVASLPSAAVRRVRRWGNGSVRELVAWCLLRSDGCLGLLHVMPGHRRRGLAQRCVASLQGTLTATGSLQALAEQAHASKSGANTPLPACAFLADYNTASQRLFAGMGFAQGPAVTWLVSSRVCRPHLVCRALAAPCATAPPAAGLLPPSVAAALQEAGGEPPLTPPVWHAVFAAMNAAYREDDGFALDQLRVQWDDVQALAAQCKAHPVDQAMLCLLPTRDQGVQGGVPPPAAAAWWQSNHASCFAPVAPSALLAGFVHLRSEGGVVGGLQRSIARACPEAAQLAADSTVLHVHVGWLCVPPMYKGRGLSVALLDEARRWAQSRARAAGCSAALLHAHVIHVKPWLPQWYKQQGFRVHASAPWPAELRSQLKQDALFWAAVQWLPV